LNAIKDQGGEGNAGIRHPDGHRGRPANRVQFLDVVSPSTGWTLGAVADRSVGNLISLINLKANFQPCASMPLSSNPIG
jgi:hypothetical protein